MENQLKLVDYEASKKAEELLGGFRFQGQRPPIESVSSNELLFIVHQQLPRELDQQLIANGWSCERSPAGETAYEFRKPCAQESLLSVRRIASVCEIVAILGMVSIVLSYLVGFRVLGYALW